MVNVNFDSSQLLTQYCLSTASSQPIEDVARANDEGASEPNDSNSIHHYEGLTGLHYPRGPC